MVAGFTVKGQRLGVNQAWRVHIFKTKHIINYVHFFNFFALFPKTILRMGHFLRKGKRRIRYSRRTWRRYKGLASNRFLRTFRAGFFYFQFRQWFPTREKNKRGKIFSKLNLREPLLRKKKRSFFFFSWRFYQSNLLKFLPFLTILRSFRKRRFLIKKKKKILIKKKKKILKILYLIKKSEDLSYSKKNIQKFLKERKKKLQFFLSFLSKKKSEKI